MTKSSHGRKYLSPGIYKIDRPIDLTKPGISNVVIVRNGVRLSDEETRQIIDELRSADAG